MRIESTFVDRPIGYGPSRRQGRLHVGGVLVLAGLAMLTGLLGCRPGSAVGTAPVNTFEIQANQIWQDTGIDLAAGESVWLSAEGTWHRGDQAASAAGLLEEPRDDAALPDVPLMCVLFRVGDDAPIALVERQTLKPKRAGRLFAQANHLELSTNSGSVTLRVEGGRQRTDVVPLPPLLPSQQMEREFQAFKEQTLMNDKDKIQEMVFAYCAQHLGTSQAKRATSQILSEAPSFVNSIGMQFRPIPPGRFKMGDGELVDAPPHEVTLTRPFYLGAHEVTIGQFRQFVAATKYRTDAEKQGFSHHYFGPKAEWNIDPAAKWDNPGFAHTDEHPAVHISWNDATAFCDWLSKKEGRQYRLPTEAEWEYACRAGTTTPYYWGHDERGAREYANLADASLKKPYPGWHYYINDWNDGFAHTAPVGSFRPNAWGLYDMSGNAWEWCADWYGRDYYKSGPRTDPRGPATGYSKVMRGASWTCDIGYARSGYRYCIHTPSSHNCVLGFRVVRVIPAAGESLNHRDTEGTEKTQR